MSARGDDRSKRDVHALNAEGMVLCNPRDREAAHRAQVGGIATGEGEAVTCPKCRQKGGQAAFPAAASAPRAPLKK